MEDPEWSFDELTYLLNRRSAAVLRAVHRHGGEATMPTVSGETELSRGELYHLFTDLETMVLLNQRRTVTQHGIEPVVSLTDAAQEAIEDGILDEFEEEPTNDGARRIWKESLWLDGIVHR